MSAMPGMWVQSAVCADVARCGSGMSGMWPRGSRNLLLSYLILSYMLSITVHIFLAVCERTTMQINVNYF